MSPFRLGRFGRLAGLGGNVIGFVFSSELPRKTSVCALSGMRLAGGYSIRTRSFVPEVHLKSSSIVHSAESPTTRIFNNHRRVPVRSPVAQRISFILADRPNLK